MNPLRSSADALSGRTRLRVAIFIGLILLVVALVVGPKLFS